MLSLCLLITCYPVDDSQQSTIFRHNHAFSLSKVPSRPRRGEMINLRSLSWGQSGANMFWAGLVLSLFATPGIPAVWAIRFEFFSSITWYIVTKYYMQILQNQYSLLYKFSGHDNEIKIMNKESIIDTLLFIESSLRSHSVSSRVSSHEIESPSNTT